MKRCGALQIVLVPFISFSIACSGRADDSGYTFSINGEPVTPGHYSLNGDASVFAPGDVIYVGDKQFNYGGLFVTLGEEKQCRFVTLSAESGDSASAPLAKDGRVFLELPDGRRKVAAITITMSFRRKPEVATGRDEKGQISFDETLVNPLDDMSPEEIHGLWGIYLHHWPAGIEQKLAHVDAERVCIALNDYAGMGGTSSGLSGPLFPPIPPKIRYLVVRDVMGPGLSDFSALGQFRDLNFLSFGKRTRSPLDAGLICQSTPMHYLDISGCEFKDYTKLASLTELRALNVSRCGDLTDIEFVKGMRHLRRLSFGQTGVSSLSPLDNSASIREIYASASDVRILPKGELSALKTIHVISTQVSAKAVEQFQKAHPACDVQYRWMDSLRKAIQGTTRLRVRAGGTCYPRSEEEEETLVEITDAEEIDRFVKGILIDESQSGGHCMCCGSPTFEFYAGERLLAMVGYHHGERVRWAGGTWTGDGELTDPSRDFLNSWLSQHGVEGPRREVEEKQKRQDEQIRQQQRYAELMPRDMLVAASQAQSSREVSGYDSSSVDKRKKLVADAFLKHEPDAETSVRLYLRMLGVIRDRPWNEYGYYDELIVKYLLPRFNGPELARAALATMTDEEGMAGAARWFLGDKGWRNLDESDCERVLRPLAKQALENHYMDTRKEVMHVLSEINGAWAAELLRSMLSRPTDPSWVPSKDGYGWRVNFGGGDQVFADECSDAVWAAFCLAKMGDAESLPAIERLAAGARGEDKDLLAKALQLLRERAAKTPPNSG